MSFAPQSPQRVPLDGPKKIPKVVNIYGRRKDAENPDVAGTYRYTKSHGGFPAFEHSKTRIVIRYFEGRWCIDRHGYRNSNKCVAWGYAAPNCSHPADPTIVWHVFDSRIGGFAEDPNMFATEAPDEITFAGRGLPCSQNNVNGKYILHGMNDSYVYYAKQAEDHTLVLSFCPSERRWVIKEESTLNDSCCIAFADENVGSNPLDATLVWNFWEQDTNTFQQDPNAGLFAAPELVNIVGRKEACGNSPMNGCYQIAGRHGGRPWYLNLTTGYAIRYSPSQDTWLIDCDGNGTRKPGFLERISEWILSGDASNAENRCCGFAAASGAEHPGICDLKWYIWDGDICQHILDPSVACTHCPLKIQIVGRDPRRENSCINGEYMFIGIRNFRAAYAKGQSGTEMSPIYLYFHLGYWILDGKGLQGDGRCVAYASVSESDDYPKDLGMWKVHSTGKFVLDESVRLRMPLDAWAASLAVGPPTSRPIEFGLGSPAPMEFRGAKRGLGMGAEHDLPMESQQVKYARIAPQSQQGRPGWLGFFGGA